MRAPSHQIGLLPTHRKGSFDADRAPMAAQLHFTKVLLIVAGFGAFVWVRSAGPPAWGCWRAFCSTAIPAQTRHVTS